MGNFDSKTAKIMIALIAIFTMIIVCLPYAYRNVQNDTENAINKQNEYSVPVHNERFNPNDIKNRFNNNDDDNDDNVSEEKEVRKNERKSQIKLEEINEDEKIPEIESNIFAKADSLRDEKKYESAVYEYEQIAKSASDNKIKAKCYENIAMTYAYMKRYSTALPYAEKSYDIEATTERQFLLARLLYKTGHEDKASEKIDEILNSDFE